MSSLAFLVTELQVRKTGCMKDDNLIVWYGSQSLASETRRKHPEIREVFVYLHEVRGYEC